MSRIKFAVVREDPEIEVALCARLGAARALVVASGGCTALTLAHRFPSLRVTAFDIAAGQLAHVEEKRAAVARGDLAALNVGTDDPGALNQRGDFEGLFRVLRGFIEEFVAPRDELRRFFSNDPFDRAPLVARWTSSRYWPVAFQLALHEGLLETMFGPAATQHAERGSYPRYFQRAFERGVRHEGAAGNPFLRHILLGAYAADAPPGYALAGRDLPVDLVHGSLPDVADLARFDLFHLSNVFDWADDDLTASWAAALARGARPGSAIVVRQLNNSRDIRRFFGRAFAFDDALGGALQREERSLFYERVEVAFRTESSP